MPKVIHALHELKTKYTHFCLDTFLFPVSFHFPCSYFYSFFVCSNTPIVFSSPRIAAFSFQLLQLWYLIMSHFFVEFCVFSRAKHTQQRPKIYLLFGGFTLHMCKTSSWHAHSFVSVEGLVFLLLCLVYSLLLRWISQAGSWLGFADVWHMLLRFVFRTKFSRKYPIKMLSCVQQNPSKCNSDIKWDLPSYLTLP